ncbi:hypothetical protein JCM8547_004067 [Rhodosporidiobolus lusitaniae]
MTDTLTLNTGVTIPRLGLGCWMGIPVSPCSEVNDDTFQMVKRGLELGYMHLDTASGYGNEESVGRAIRESGKTREEIFLTTKLNNPDHGRVREAFDASLARLGTEYIDLYLMHWPQAIGPNGPLPPDASPTFVETWQAMERLFLEERKGKVKAIGVSNFSIQNLSKLLEVAKVVPAVEAHPFLPNTELAEYCKEKGIVMTAYSPLGQGPLILSDPLLTRLSSRYSRPAGSIVLSWALQRDPGNWTVVPKSSNPERLRQNLETVTLEQEDLDALSALHKEPGKYTSLCDFGNASEPAGVLFGWRIKEDLGFDYPITVREDGGWQARMRERDASEGK